MGAPTNTDLSNLSLNFKSIDDVVNGLEDTQITTRLGKKIWTLSTVNSKVNGVIAAATQAQTDINNKVAAVYGGYFAAFDTLANLQASTGAKTGQVAKVMNDPTAANNGDYRYTGSAWVKGYDVLTDAKTYAKSYTDSHTNINFFKGFEANGVPSTIAFSYTLNQTSSNVTMDGGRLALTLPTKGKLANTVSVWLNVDSAVLNSGAMRALVQVRKKDATNLHSAYYNIPNATTGWYKLVDVNVSAALPSDIDAVIVNPEATGGAVLTLSDIYVGESTPNNGLFSRFEKYDDDILRSATKVNVIPRFEQLPIIAGVTYSGERISIANGKTFAYQTAISDKQVLYVSALVNQASSKDMRLRFIGYPTDGSSAVTRDLYTTATNGLEFSSSVDFGKPIKQVNINVTSLTANAISLDRFIVSYNQIMQSKRVESIKVVSALSDLIDDTASNIAINPKIERIHSNNNAIWTTSGITLNGVSNVQVRQRIAEMGLKVGDVVYLNFKGSALKNTGVASVSQSQIKTDNSSVAGSTTNFIDGSNLLVNIPVTITTDSQFLQLSFNTTADANLTITDLIISDQKVFSNSKIVTLHSPDETGTQVSLFPYPKMIGYETIGNQIAYNRYLDDNNDWVVEIPPTDTTVTRGQGMRFAFNYPSSFLGVGGYLNVQLASASTNTVTAYVRYKKDNAILQEQTFNIPIKNNSEYTDYLIQLNAKNTSNVAINAVDIAFAQANTATGVLKIKRPLLSVAMPYQNIKHIEYTVDSVAETGMPKRDRVYDALTNPVIGVFSVGQQMFVAEKDNPSVVGDFAYLNGSKDLPKTLIGTKYIDGSGWEIVTIDSDETVYLKNANNTNLYKTTVADLLSRISATTLDSVSGEYRGAFDGNGLTIIANNFASTLWGKVAGDGSLICVSQTQAFYLPQNGNALVAATGYSDTIGGLLPGWLFDVQDNIVLAGGYSAAPNYGKGRINFSSDYGRTYKTILDLENQSIFGATATSKAHIHGCAWDKWWNRVWVVMGDYEFDGTATGKILWCDNPQDANPVWHIEPRDLVQPSKANEQHIAVYPMEHCILFGSDCNPSYIARRARVSKDKATLTDMAYYLHEGLAYYPAQFWQHRNDLPVTIFLGSDLLDRYGNNPDGVLITYDGVNFSRIWSDKNKYSNTSGRTSSYAYALTNERFILQKRVDPRFSSGICWVVGRLKL